METGFHPLLVAAVGHYPFQLPWMSASQGRIFCFLTKLSERNQLFSKLKIMLVKLYLKGRLCLGNLKINRRVKSCFSEIFARIRYCKDKRETWTWGFQPISRFKIVAGVKKHLSQFFSFLNRLHFFTNLVGLLECLFFLLFSLLRVLTYYSGY